LILNVLNGPPVILINKGQNDGTKNHWIGLELRGKKSNRMALGARVTVEIDRGDRTIFEVSTSSSYLSANDPRINAGLGPTTSVTSVVIKWPSGSEQRLSNLKVDQYHHIEEP
jgi:hypothetical protein